MEAEHQAPSPDQTPQPSLDQTSEPTPELTPEPTPARRWSWLDTHGPVVGALLVFVPLVALYLLTANATRVQANDAIATALPAHQFVTEGNLTMDAYEDAPWLREGSDGRMVSNRFPGTVFLAVPAMWLHHQIAGDEFSHFPGAITASVVTAAAMAVLYLVLRHVTSPGRALAATFVAGLATSTWSISADTLWTHGPTQLFLGLSLLGLATERWARSGLALGFAVFTRPPTAVIAATLGLGELLRLRRLAPALRIGAVSLLGVGALVLYNWQVHGTPDPVGGYNPDHLNRIATMTVPRYLQNVAGTFLSPGRGVLVLSPFLLLLLPGLRRGWREVPGWGRTAAVAGVLYLLFHLRINRFSGGFDFITYRLTLEPLTMAAPLLVASYLAWVRARRWRLGTFWALVGLSFGIHAVAAHATSRDVDAGPWTFGELFNAIAHTHPVLLGLLAVAVPLGWWLGRRLYREPKPEPEPAATLEPVAP